MTVPLDSDFDPNVSDASFLRRFWNNASERVARMTVENTVGIEVPDDEHQGGAPMASRAPNLGIVPTAVLPDLTQPTFEEVLAAMQGQTAVVVDNVPDNVRQEVLQNGWSNTTLRGASSMRTPIAAVPGGTITGLPLSNVDLEHIARLQVMMRDPLASTPPPVLDPDQPMQHIRLDDGNYYCGPVRRAADNEIGMDGRTWLQRERDAAEARARQIEEQAEVARLRRINAMAAEQQAANIEMDEAIRAFESTLSGITPTPQQPVSVKYANNKLTIEITHERLAHASVRELVLALLQAAGQSLTAVAAPVATLPNTERGIQLPRKRRQDGNQTEDIVENRIVQENNA